MIIVFIQYYISLCFVLTDDKRMGNGSLSESMFDRGAESVLSNAPEITSHGPGLREAVIGQKNTFYVDCSKAGKFCTVTTTISAADMSL